MWDDLPKNWRLAELNEIRRFHAEGVIKNIEPLVDGFIDDFDITDHLMISWFIRLDDEFDFADVTAGKPALVRVFGQHVAVLDLEEFADAIHGRRFQNRLSR